MNATTTLEQDAMSIKSNVTTAAIEKLIKDNGLECEVAPSEIMFRYRGESYFVLTDKLPMVTVEKYYNIGPEDGNTFALSAAKVNQDNRIVICRVESGEGDVDASLSFVLSFFENDINHLAEMASLYLKSIDESEDYFSHVLRQVREYMSLSETIQNQKQMKDKC